MSSLKIPPQKCFYGERHYASGHLTKKCNKNSKPINTSVIVGIIITRCDELRGMLVPACHYCCCSANVRNIVAACRYGTSVAGARKTYQQQLNRINYGLQLTEARGIKVCCQEIWWGIDVVTAEFHY